MTNTRWVIVAIVCILAISLVTILPALYRPFYRDFLNRVLPFERPPWDLLFPYLFIAKTVLSSVNSILLTIVLVMYLEIYRKTKSQFSLGLVIFGLALLLYALTSNPLLHWLVGFRVAGLGPFTMLPDLFTCIASTILLYLSQQ